ncbi:hypothetical protein [Geodermatophilus sp. URMC 64]
MKLDNATVDFATNFVVDGRQTILRFSEFEGPAGFRFRAGVVEAELDVLYEEDRKWIQLRAFRLAITENAAATIPTAFITYDNAATLPE